MFHTFINSIFFLNIAEGCSSGLQISRNAKLGRDAVRLAANSEFEHSHYSHFIQTVSYDRQFGGQTNSTEMYGLRYNPELRNRAPPLAPTPNRRGRSKALGLPVTHPVQMHRFEG